MLCLFTCGNGVICLSDVIGVAGVAGVVSDVACGHRVSLGRHGSKGRKFPAVFPLPFLREQKEKKPRRKKDRQKERKNGRMDERRLICFVCADVLRLAVQPVQVHSTSVVLLGADHRAKRTLLRVLARLVRRRSVPVLSGEFCWEEERRWEKAGEAGGGGRDQWFQAATMATAYQSTLWYAQGETSNQQRPIIMTLLINDSAGEAQFD